MNSEVFLLERQSIQQRINSHRDRMKEDYVRNREPRRELFPWDSGFLGSLGSTGLSRHIFSLGRWVGVAGFTYILSRVFPSRYRPWLASLSSVVQKVVGS